MEIILSNKQPRPWGGAPYSLLRADETENTKAEMEEEIVLTY